MVQTEDGVGRVRISDGCAVSPELGASRMLSVRVVPLWLVT